MLRLTTIRGCGVLTALALLALGGPAAADTKGTLAIVNGIPGTRVDVCVNDREIRSGLRYGGAVLRDVIGTGNKRLRFYARDPRRCRGTLLAQRDVVLDPGEDLTIVATRRAPKVVIFANVGLGEIPRSVRRTPLAARTRGATPRSRRSTSGPAPGTRAPRRRSPRTPIRSGRRGTSSCPAPPPA